MNIITEIEKYGIIPILTLEQKEEAIPVAQALKKGGLPVAEVTFRTEAALQSIEAIAGRYPDMLLGAGTVLNIDQAKSAVKAGAKFLVTPGMNTKVLEFCVNNVIPVIPGCASPTDIETAIEYGLDTVKVFPVEPLGGLPVLKAISGPYVKMRYVPTGGVSADNIGEYTRFKNVLACGGSFMVKTEWIRQKEYEKITTATVQAISAMLGFEFGHVGLNMPDEAEAMKTANGFETYFGLPLKAGASSVFAGPCIEIKKEMAQGIHGHIAMKTNSIKKACEYLKRMGLETVMESVKTNAQGNITALFIDADFGGFAVHLLQK